MYIRIHVHVHVNVPGLFAVFAVRAAIEVGMRAVVVGRVVRVVRVGVVVVMVGGGVEGAAGVVATGGDVDGARESPRPTQLLPLYTHTHTHTHTHTIKQTYHLNKKRLINLPDIDTDMT